VTGRRRLLAGYRGHIDTVEPAMSGWLTEIARPGKPVAFAVRIDGHDCGTAVTDRARADVAAARLAGLNCGFSVALPARFFDGQEHELALLLPDGRRLNLPGCPPRVALGRVAADIVSAADASLEAVADLLRRTDEEAGFEPDSAGVDDAKRFNAVVATGGGFVFYARCGTRLVGYARLDRGLGEAATLGVVALTMLEAFRRKGLGEALMRRLLRMAHDTAGMREVWLSVRPDNTPALHLYEKLGFIRDANRPSGQWASSGEITMLWLPHPRSSGR
jgi:ribosomal protein S18 acetylase RimI-like enzyme